MRVYTKLFYSLCLLILLGLSSENLIAQNLENFEEKVTEFTLDNGLHFIIIERHDAPVVSFYTQVNVGGIDEPMGNTGIAHIFEHLAFKGDHYVGTTDWVAEKKVIDQMDEVYKTWLYESYKPNPDTGLMAEKWEEFQALQEEAKTYVVNNEFSQVVQRNGGTGMNASTRWDFTDYFYSLPSNKVELWFSLEAGRFMQPTYREFYIEKEVVREERRMRTDSNPFGRLVEEFLATAYAAHPYGRPIVGWNSDITASTIEDAHEFYETYYVPSNITFGIAGDVDPEQMKKFAEEYFGDMRGKGKVAPPVTTIEPEQRGERRVVIEGNSQPLMMFGYHTVSATHPDYEPLILLGRILSSGRTSILYKEFIEEQQTALQIQNFEGIPGTRYPGLFLSLVVPNTGVDLDSLEQSIYDEFDEVKEGAITQEQLDRVRTNLRAGIIRSLANNTGLASYFVNTHVEQGSWKDVFNQLDRYEAVTLEDLQRVASTYLTKKNRTVGLTVKIDS
ncbi:MAG: insulinase family protein [Balneolaceae bacterium]|nr:insulinase family protein [Balneolaceae bacterium]MBO6547924.1 insulinase family protein [Balneolaceae bacterium]MBO6648437.1 insulinase family protein [Balneolaceae bacterium]